MYDLSRNNLRELFGKFGEVIYDRIRGVDDRQLDLSRIRKSIGVEYTFERDLKNYNELLKKPVNSAKSWRKIFIRKILKRKQLGLK